MKKLLALLLACLVLTSLCACGSKEDSETPDTAAPQETAPDAPDSTNPQDAEATEEPTEAPTEAPKQVEYYDECTDLPKADTIIDVSYSGSSKSTSNGTVTKIVYKYSGDASAAETYAATVGEYGLIAESDNNGGYNIVSGSYVVANASMDGETLLINIVPENARAMSDNSAQKISIGETITTDNYTFTLNNVELTYELKPRNTSSVYSSYTADSGKVYIHIDGTYTNTSKRDICIRDLFLPKGDYDNGYKYDGFVVIDDGDNSFDWVSSYVACTPLESCHYHGLIECPEIVDNSDAPLFVTFTLDNGITYRYDIRK